VAKRSFLALCIVLAGLELTPAAFAASSAASGTLAITVLPQCSLSIVSQNAQTVTFLYKVRTSVATGQGQIVVRFTTASPAGSLEGSTVDYQVQLDGPGTALSGSAPLSSGVVIVRFGPQAGSSRAGSTGTLQFSAPLPLVATLSIACQ